MYISGTTAILIVIMNILSLTILQRTLPGHNAQPSVPWWFPIIASAIALRFGTPIIVPVIFRYISNELNAIIVGR